MTKRDKMNGSVLVGSSKEKGTGVKPYKLARNGNVSDRCCQRQPAAIDPPRSIALSCNNYPDVRKEPKKRDMDAFDRQG